MQSLTSKVIVAFPAHGFNLPHLGNDARYVVAVRRRFVEKAAQKRRYD